MLKPQTLLFPVAVLLGLGYLLLNQLRTPPTTLKVIEGAYSVDVIGPLGFTTPVKPVYGVP